MLWGMITTERSEGLPELRDQQCPVPAVRFQSHTRLSLLLAHQPSVRLRKTTVLIRMGNGRQFTLAGEEIP